MYRCKKILVSLLIYNAPLLTDSTPLKQVANFLQIIEYPDHDYQVILAITGRAVSCLTGNSFHSLPVHRTSRGEMWIESNDWNESCKVPECAVTLSPPSSLAKLGR
jgi:hypothetical protein